MQLEKTQRIYRKAHTNALASLYRIQYFYDKIFILFFSHFQHFGYDS